MQGEGVMMSYTEMSQNKQQQRSQQQQNQLNATLRGEAAENGTVTAEPESAPRATGASENT